MSDTWHKVIAESSFPEEGKLSTIINGWYVLLGKIDDGYHAVNDRCTHAAAFLSTGRIRRGAVMCPLHGARFELASGKCLGGGYKDLRTFAVRITDGEIEVQIPDTPPSAEDVPIAQG